MEKSITVDKTKCIHCGMCINDCLMSCLAFEAEKIPSYNEGGKDRCVSCQHCMTICPKGALSFGGLNPEDSEAVYNGNGAEILSLIKSRRSVRNYKKADVPAEKLAMLKEMLAYTPTGANLPSLHFTIVGSREKMQAIQKLTYERLDSVAEDSFLKQMKGFLDMNMANGKEMIYRGAPAMVVVAVNPKMVAPTCDTVDPIIALSYLELYANSIGLGTLWDDFAFTVMNEIPEVAAMLEIPEGYRISFVLLLGIPAVKYKRTPQRKVHSMKVLQ